MSNDLIIIKETLTYEQYKHIKKGGTISWKINYLKGDNNV